MSTCSHVNVCMDATFHPRVSVELGSEESIQYAGIRVRLLSPFTPSFHEDNVGHLDQMVPDAFDTNALVVERQVGGTRSGMDVRVFIDACTHARGCIEHPTCRSGERRPSAARSDPRRRWLPGPAAWSLFSPSRRNSHLFGGKEEKRNEEARTMERERVRPSRWRWREGDDTLGVRTREEWQTRRFGTTKERGWLRGDGKENRRIACSW